MKFSGPLPEKYSFVSYSWMIEWSKKGR